jgi:TolA-binding protein
MGIASRARKAVLPVLGAAAFSASVAGALAAFSAARKLDRLISSEGGEKGAESKVETKLRRADRAMAQGEMEIAAVLYGELLATNATLSEEEKLAASLGLARVQSALGEKARARTAIRSALAFAGRAMTPEDLVELGEQALRAGAFREARRLFYSALALEDQKKGDADRTKTLARAAMRIADTYRAEARSNDSEEPPSAQPIAPLAAASGGIVPLERPPWEAVLRGPDPLASPLIALEAGPKNARLATVRAEKASAESLLALFAEQVNWKLLFSESARAIAHDAAVSAELSGRPIEEVFATLAGAAGLEIASGAAEGEIRLEGRPLGAVEARERAKKAYFFALERAGADQARAHLEIGELERAAGRFEAAAAEYRAVIEHAPRSPELPLALLGLARAEAGLLRFARARDALFRLIRDPGVGELAPQALFLIAESYLGEGRDEDAEKTLRHLLASFPAAKERVAARRRLAQVLYGRRKYEEALDAFRAAAGESEEESDRFESALGAARCLFELGRFGESIRALASPLAKSANKARAPEAYLLLARAFHEADEHLGALFALEHIRKRFPESAEAREAESLFLRESVDLGLLRDAETRLFSAATTLRGAEVLALAKALLAAGEPARARAVLDRRVLPDEQSAVPSALLRARSYLFERNAKACLRALESVRGQSLSGPERVELARLAGDAQALLGRFDCALAAYRDASLGDSEP